MGPDRASASPAEWRQALPVDPALGEYPDAGEFRTLRGDDPCDAAASQGPAASRRGVGAADRFSLSAAGTGAEMAPGPGSVTVPIVSTSPAAHNVSLWVKRTFVPPSTGHLPVPRDACVGWAVYRQS